MKHNKYINLLMVVFMLTVPIVGSVAFFNYALYTIPDADMAHIIVLLVWLGIFSFVYYIFRVFGNKLMTEKNLKDYFQSDQKLRRFYLVINIILPIVIYLMLLSKYGSETNLFVLPVVYLHQYVLDKIAKKRK